MSCSVDMSMVLITSGPGLISQNEMTRVFFELLDAYKCWPFNIMSRINFMLI